jgi:hypothetical protein
VIYDHTERFKMIEFRGYAYHREPSPISGRIRIRYDAQKPVIWKIPLYDELKTVVAVRVPSGGYLIPPAVAAWLVKRLDAHGIEHETLEAVKPADVEVFRATEVNFKKESYEGRTPVSVKGAWSREKRTLPAGTVWVPIAQRTARLVVHLLDPNAPDSFLAWGFMNAIFEKKEYMEPYIAERVAAEMLEKDPAIRAEFEKKLEADKEFAKDPERRLEMFYRRHSSWDAQLNQYPVLRTDRRP